MIAENSVPGCCESGKFKDLLFYTGAPEEVTHGTKARRQPLKRKARVAKLFFTIHAMVA